MVEDSCVKCGKVMQDPQQRGTYFMTSKKTPVRKIFIGKFTSVTLDAEDNVVGVVFDCPPADVSFAMLDEVSEFRLTTKYRAFIEAQLTAEAEGGSDVGENTCHACFVKNVQG